MRWYRFPDRTCALTIWILSTAVSLPLAAQPPTSKGTKGRYIEIDTRDRAACAFVQQTLAPLREVKTSQTASISRSELDFLCARPTADDPIVSVLTFEPSDKASEYAAIKLQMKAELKAMNKNGPSSVLWIQDQPEFDIPQTSDLDTRERRYRDPNEKLAPAIRHPISGAASYTLARTSGRSQLAAFGRSLMMSTYYWQPASGLPNTEEVLVGPIFSSVLGELIYQTAATIRANDGKVMGSRPLGVAALIVVDPAGSIADGVNRVAGKKVITQAFGELVAGRKRPDPRLPYQSLSSDSSYIGVRFHFQFWGL